MIPFLINDSSLPYEGRNKPIANLMVNRKFKVESCRKFEDRHFLSNLFEYCSDISYLCRAKRIKKTFDAVNSGRVF